MRRLVVLTAVTGTLVLGVTASAGWGASGMKYPSPPRAKAAVATVQDQVVANAPAQEAPAAAEAPQDGFCLNIDRDSRWLCLLRQEPRSPFAGDDCRTLFRLDGLVSYVDCRR
jgi:hypothetical protein